MDQLLGLPAPRPALLCMAAVHDGITEVCCIALLPSSMPIGGNPEGCHTGLLQRTHLSKFLVPCLVAGSCPQSPGSMSQGGIFNACWWALTACLVLCRPVYLGLLFFLLVGQERHVRLHAGQQNQIYVAAPRALRCL